MLTEPGSPLVLILLAALIIVVLLRPRSSPDKGVFERKIDLLTFARGITQVISIPHAIASVTPFGWWIFGIGISALFSDSLEEKLIAFYSVIVVAPLFVLWFLWHNRNHAAALALGLEGLSFFLVAWDRFRQELTWGYVLIALVQGALAVALVAGAEGKAGEPPTARPVT